MSQSALVAKSANSQETDASPRGLLDRLGDVPAWLLSVLVHLGLVFIFASMVYSTGLVEPEIEIVSAIEEPELEEYAFETATEMDEIGNESNLNTVSPSQAIASMPTESAEQFQERLEREFDIAELPAQEMMVSASEVDLAAAFNVAGTTEHTGGVEGAIDRLTNEIAASLREKETTVAWVFDASLSLRRRRDAIADRFKTIHTQLEKQGVLGEGRLHTVAATYADQTRLLTKEPTTDYASVAQKIREIPDPKSGTENVIQAVGRLTKEFLYERTRERRNMMVVIVTDERGDDFNVTNEQGNEVSLLNKAITDLKKFGIKVYCVGNAAPLGQVKEYIRWKYDDGFVQMLPVDRGPETAVPQRLGLPFWGKGPPKTLSSGYGPYGLTRLCAETGGLYLVSDETAKSFDPAVMRNYAPDYRPARQIEQDIAKNRAKMALVSSATYAQKDKIKSLPLPANVFPAKNDNELRRALNEAQKPQAELDHELKRIAAMLEVGLKDREKLREPRWRATFDLAVGRVAALRARSFGYNMVLAEMKVAPKSFEKKNSNQWALEPSEEIAGGPAVKNLAETARKYLSRVVDEHPGTPWASLAARELSTPMGWKWVEQNELVERFGPRAADPDVARLLLAEEEEKRKERAKMKPKQRTPPEL